MKGAASVMFVALTAGSIIAPFVRDTNSTASVKRGVRAFEKKEYAEAAEAFRRAARIRDDAAVRYDLGTAEIAAGHEETGAQLLDSVLEDPALRPDGLYNRGNAALKANKLDDAIADYTAALRARPGDADAKRNLEIALRKKQEQQQQQNQQGQGDQPQQQPGGEDQESQSPSPGDQEQPPSGVESLLRSIEQQEREELARMQRARPAPARIGW